MIGTSRGMFRTGSVRRRPPSEMWSKQMIDEIIGDPENPVPGQHSGRPPTFSKEESAVNSAPTVIQHQMPPPTPEVQARGLYVRRGDVKTHGPTEKCAGCRAVMTDGETRTHSHACRARFEAILVKEESTR